MYTLFRAYRHVPNLRARTSHLQTASRTLYSKPASMTAAALFASITPVSSDAQPAPEDVSALVHHAKNGKGFINPWESWKDIGLKTIFQFAK